MAKQDKDFIVITADLCQSSGLTRFREEYRERMINVGIAEQNLIGVSATVIDMHTIKPIDTECLDSLKEYQLIVTVEEASTIGGLGSAVAEYYSSMKNRPPHLIIGIKDVFPHAGSYEHLLEQCGLTGEK